MGGANTKAAFIKAECGAVAEFRCELTYFPFWKRKPSELVDAFLALKEKVCSSEALDCVAITMTAELSDVFQTKREGVNKVLDAVCKAFSPTEVLVLDVNAELRSVDSARFEPLSVASANWVATGWMVAQYLAGCVVVDVGSTSTSIIPVKEGKVAAEGKTDLEKLINGELVYTGSLRTNVAAIVDSVPIRGGVARVSSELFAQSGDMHLLLGNIKKEDYWVDTADGRGKTQKEAAARLARVVCADTEMLSEKEIIRIAEYVYERQIEQIAEGLCQVYQRLKVNAEATIPAVVTGFGKDFLAKKAAQKSEIANTVDIDDLLPANAALASPAVGVAMMAATKLEGRRLRWTQ